MNLCVFIGHECFFLLSDDAGVELQINEDPSILPNVTLVPRYVDTRGDTVKATEHMVDMLCEGVSAFFGPEGSCYVEAIVAQSKNIPMISYVSPFFIPLIAFSRRQQPLYSWLLSRKGISQFLHEPRNA